MRSGSFRPHITTEAKHDTGLVGLNNIDTGKEPYHQRGKNPPAQLRHAVHLGKIGP